MYYINATPVFAATSRLFKRWKCLLFSSIQGGRDPMVWSLNDRYGVPYWLICDPQADRPLEARTEDEVRQILGQRYR